MLDEQTVFEPEDIDDDLRNRMMPGISAMNEDVVLSCIFCNR